MTVRWAVDHRGLWQTTPEGWRWVRAIQFPAVDEHGIDWKTNVSIASELAKLNHRRMLAVFDAA